MPFPHKRTIKVIDLLKRIAKNKNIPKKIELLSPVMNKDYRKCTWNGCWFEYDKDGTDVTFCTNHLELNDKIKIIE